MSATTTRARAKAPTFVSTRNACNLCAPLGACLAFRGVEGCVPYIHGSQGCATYIRRYMISHFKEPVDIASSSFAESAAIFGGERNFAGGLRNVIAQYQPAAIGIASTCLSETIGDDVRMFLHAFRKQHPQPLPELIPASTPSYSGSHAEGYVAALRALVEQLAEGGCEGSHVNLISGIVSPADLRYLKEIAADYEVASVLLPDYADTLDGGAWDHYMRIPPGGTPIDAIRRMGAARATLEMGTTGDAQRTAGHFLEDRFSVPNHRVDLPIGVRLSDAFMQRLQAVTGRAMPVKHAQERARLLDAYADGHKYIFGKRAIVYGEEDFVVGLAALLVEVGIQPALCASGGNSGRLGERIAEVTTDALEDITVMQDTDFLGIEAVAQELRPDLIVGNSKGHKLAQTLDVPLVRVGFPVHDRLGGARMLHLGYRGAQALFDRIANTLIEAKQKALPDGYFYM